MHVGGCAIGIASLILLAVDDTAIAFTLAPPSPLARSRATLQRKGKLHVATSSANYRQKNQVDNEAKQVDILTDYTSAAVAGNAIDLALYSQTLSGEQENYTASLTSAAFAGNAIDLSLYSRTLSGEQEESTASLTTTNRFSSTNNGADTTTASNSPVQTRRPTMIKSLAFLAGISDVICHRRHGCFANMMTGNTIQAANALSTLRWADMAFHLCLLGSYMVGFGIYRAVDWTSQQHYERQRGKKRRMTPEIVAPIVFTIFAMYDALACTTSRRWTVPVLVAGSAMVNAAGLESTGSVTNMMTGNLQKISNYVADCTLHRLLGGPKASAELKKGASTSARIAASFFGGIVMTSAAMKRGGTILSKSLGLEASVLSGIAQLPHFTIIGASYALLLILHSRSRADTNSKRISLLKLMQVAFSRLSRRSGESENGQKVADPCVLDVHGAECLSKGDSCTIDSGISIR